MAKYEKWLGASVGWLTSGNPVGGLVGFIAGSLLGNKNKPATSTSLGGISEFETHLIVLATHLIKIDRLSSHQEVTFLRTFLDTHFDETMTEKRAQVIHHCLQKEYDLNIVCDSLRMYAEHATKVQIVHFLFDLAESDGDLNERENYFIFRIAGYLNVNDVEFRRIKKERIEQFEPDHAVLGVAANANMKEITDAYRRLVLKYHPDRHTNATTEEKKKLGEKFNHIQQAYKNIKERNGK